MFKRLLIVPISVTIVSGMSMAMAPLREEVSKPVVRDSVQLVLPTTTSTTTTTVEVAPPPVPTTTTIPAGDWKCPQWLGLATEVGWPVSELPMLDKTLWKESRCNSDSFNPSDPMGGSYGLSQTNGFWCESTKYHPNGWLQGQGILYTCADLFDPTTNLRAALAIWQRSGWSPWY